MKITALEASSIILGIIMFCLGISAIFDKRNSDIDPKLDELRNIRDEISEIEKDPISQNIKCEAEKMYEIYSEKIRIEIISFLQSKYSDDVEERFCLKSMYCDFRYEIGRFVNDYFLKHENKERMTRKLQVYLFTDIKKKLEKFDQQTTKEIVKESMG